MYAPNQHELKALLEIVSRFGQADTARSSRQNISTALLQLLESDYLASYVWNQDSGAFEDCVAMNIAPAHLESYDRYFQHRDPISPRMRRRREATIVSHVISQQELEKTEFFNDFLIVAGLHHGLDMHLFDGDDHVGDLRIWRARGRPEFGAREVALLEMLRPHLVTTLKRLSALARERADAQRWHALWMQHPHASFILDRNGRETCRNASAEQLTSRLSIRQSEALPALLRDAALEQSSLDLWNDFNITVANAELPGDQNAAGVRMVQIVEKKSPALDAAELCSRFNLTQREADVCALVLQGYTDKEISKALAISFPTVRTHLTPSFSKSSVSNRAELIHRIAVPV